MDLKAAIDNFKIPTRPRIPKKIQMILSSEDNGLLMPLGVDYFCHTQGPCVVLSLMILIETYYQDLNQLPHH